MEALLILVATTLSSTASAQSITVHVDPDLAAQAGLDAPTVEADLKDVGRGDLQLADLSGYMSQMANAAVLSTKGMGVDYATNPQRFVVGGSVGSAVSGAGVQLGRGGKTVPEGGFAFQVTGMAGVNLGVLADDDSPLRRFVLTANGMMLTTAMDPFEGTLVNAGAHLTVQLVRPDGRGGLFEWGGLALSSGYEYTSYKLALSKAIPIDAGKVEWDATGRYDISASAGSVPVELCTNVRFTVLTAYLGAAVDINQGSDATTEISLSGDINADIDGETVRLGDATAKAGLTGSGDWILPRGFVGLQVNILPVKVYGQLNFSTDPALSRFGFGGNAGLRFSI